MRTSTDMPLRASCPVSFVALLSSPGCEQDVERAYDSLADIRGRDASSVVAAIHVPSDARAIRMKFDPDSDRFYVSYVTADAAYSVERSGLVPVGQANHDEVLKSIGFGVEIPKAADVYVGCRDSFIVPLQGDKAPAEVLVLANAEGRQYQWNLLHRAELMGRLCGSRP